MLCVGLYFVLHIDYFTVDGIAVVGNKEVKDEEVLKLSELHTGQNLFDVHPLFVERKIKKNLYIEDVNVNRKLPNEVEIIVEERSGKAQIAYGKKYVITDNSGMVLEIADKVRKATFIKGVKATDAELKKDVEVDNSNDWSKSMELIRITENDLYFKKIKIEGNKVNAYVYDKLVCKGAYDDVIRNIENGALKAVIFDLYQKGVESGVINIGSNNYCSFTP